MADDEGTRVDTVVPDDEWQEIVEFVKSNYPRRTYGKKFIGKKMASLALQKIREYKKETTDLRKDWKEIQAEIEDVLDVDED